MTLLEYRDPPSLEGAVALVGAREAITTDAFDCVADAWETYRHLRQLSWD
jgi:hypothetical protein